MCSQTVQLSIYHFISLSLSPPLLLSIYFRYSYYLSIYIYIFVFPHHYLFLVFASMSRDCPIIICHYFSTYPFQHFPKQTCFLAILPSPSFFGNTGHCFPTPAALVIPVELHKNSTSKEASILVSLDLNELVTIKGVPISVAVDHCLGSVGNNYWCCYNGISCMIMLGI